MWLVRHGLSAVDRSRPAHEWELDPSGFEDLAALRRSGRLPEKAVWFCSPEPKALATARRLTDGEVVVVDELREHERRTSHWFDDAAEFRAVVRGAFDRPDEAAYDGWEPLRRTAERVLPAVRRILADHAEEDVVLVGHGTAWTLLRAELTGAAPDLEAWAGLRMPDLWVLPRDVIRPGRARSRFG